MVVARILNDDHAAITAVITYTPSGYHAVKITFHQNLPRVRYARFGVA